MSKLEEIGILHHRGHAVKSTDRRSFLGTSLAAGGATTVFRAHAEYRYHLNRALKRDDGLL